VVNIAGDCPIHKQYIQKVDDVYRIIGTRVSLDSVVHAFWSGQTAESIAQSFPALTLEEVYGALTFYLANKTHINAYLQDTQAEFEAMREAAREQAKKGNEAAAQAYVDAVSVPLTIDEDSEDVEDGNSLPVSLSSSRVGSASSRRVIKSNKRFARASSLSAVSAALREPAFVLGEQGRGSNSLFKSILTELTK